MQKMQDMTPAEFKLMGEQNCNGSNNCTELDKKYDIDAVIKERIQRIDYDHGYQLRIIKDLETEIASNTAKLQESRKIMERLKKIKEDCMKYLKK